MKQYVVTGMSCAACQARVEKAVSKVPGVDSVSVSLLTNSMGVTGTADDASVIEAVENAGYGASVKGADMRGPAQEDVLKDRETPKLKKRLMTSVIFLLILMYMSMGHNMWGWPLPSFFTHNHLALTLTQMILAAIVMIINHKFFTSGFSSLIHGAPNMDTLVALGSSVSFGWSVIVFYKMCGMITAGAGSMELMDLYHNQLYFESAAMIPALITVGKMLEAMSKGRTTDALKSLMRLAPKTARSSRGSARSMSPHSRASRSRSTSSRVIRSARPQSISRDTSDAGLHASARTRHSHRLSGWSLTRRPQRRRSRELRIKSPGYLFPQSSPLP